MPPYLVCHSSASVTSESDCEFQTNLKAKKAQILKIPTFLKSVVALSFMQGQYRSRQEKETVSLLRCWSQSSCSLMPPVSMVKTTCVVLYVNGGRTKLSNQCKKSKKPSNILCLAQTWKKSLFYSCLEQFDVFSSSMSWLIFDIFGSNPLPAIGLGSQYAVSGTMKSSRHWLHLYSETERYSHHGSCFGFIPTPPIIARCSDLLDPCEWKGNRQVEWDGRCPSQMLLSVNLYTGQYLRSS